MVGEIVDRADKRDIALAAAGTVAPGYSAWRASVVDRGATTARNADQSATVFSVDERARTQSDGASLFQ